MYVASRMSQMLVEWNVQKDCVNRCERTGPQRQTQILYETLQRVLIVYLSDLNLAKQSAQTPAAGHAVSINLS